MTTTVAIKDETMDQLRHVKEEIQADTYDEVIKNLIRHFKKPATSLFGALKGVKEEFVREEIDRFS